MSSISDRSAPSPYLSIYASELQLIAGVSADWGEIETGGDLYGLLTHSGRAVVLLALPPGPNATHQATHFAQDIEHFKRINAILSTRFALQVVGSWHSHHRLGLDEPSGGDVRQVQSITGRNGIARWVDIIATFRGGTAEAVFPSGHCQAERPSVTRLGADRATSIKINSFSYPNAPSGERVRSRVNMLQGLSPIRRALLDSEILSGHDLGFQGWTFPLERVLFDAVACSAAPSKEDHGLPETLVSQLRDLPVRAKKGLTVTVKADLIVISLPIAAGIQGHIACDREQPHGVRAVYVGSGQQNEPHDVTARVLSSGVRSEIAPIYELLGTWGPGVASPGPECPARPSMRQRLPVALAAVAQHLRPGRKKVTNPVERKPNHVESGPSVSSGVRKEDPRAENAAFPGLQPNGRHLRCRMGSHQRRQSIQRQGRLAIKLPIRRTRALRHVASATLETRSPRNGQRRRRVTRISYVQPRP